MQWKSLRSVDNAETLRSAWAGAGCIHFVGQSTQVRRNEKNVCDIYHIFISEWHWAVKYIRDASGSIGEMW